MVYRRRGYRTFQRRRRTAYRGRRRRVFRRAFRRTNLSPEIKFLDKVIAKTDLDANVPWETISISPEYINQGVANGQCVGEKIRSRYVKVNMLWQGTYGSDTNKTFPDTLVRLVFWIATQDVGAIKQSIYQSSDFNRYFDYNEMVILKDITIKLANNLATTTGVSIPFSKKIQLTFPFARNMKLRALEGTQYRMDEQKDVIYCSMITTPNDVHYSGNVRLTYIDN